MAFQVKLQRQFNRRVKGKEYSKWLLVVPPEVVDQLRWAEGEDLEAHVTKEGLLLRRRRRAEPSEAKA